MVRRVALTHEAEIHRKRFRRFKHLVNIPSARRAGRGIRAGRGARSTTDHRRHSAGERFVNLLWTNEMDV